MIFDADADKFLAVMKADSTVQEEWAKDISVGPKLAEPWRTYFRRFGTLAEVQAQQRLRAQKDYFVPATRTARDFQLATELGMALCFDLHVQNGGVKSTTRKQLQPLLGAEEEVVREALANGVADSARAEYREDVRRRKLAIARGQGTVHGRAVVLANWGLSRLPAEVLG